MDVNLTGKTVIVTGGSAGIGLACAKELHAHGAGVAIAARTAERLDEAKNAIADAGAGDVLAVTADLTQPEDISRLVTRTTDRFGHVDILVNCAGSARRGKFLDLTDREFLDAWTLKFLGYVRMTRAVVPQMIERQGGCIVNIIGGAARTPEAGFLAGSTTNAAVLNFTKGLSKELAPHGIRVNAVSPGATATERAERLLEQQAQMRGLPVEQVREDRVRAIPLGRMVDAAEIATMVALIVSDRLPSMTGGEVVVDGGSRPAM